MQYGEVIQIGYGCPGTYYEKDGKRVTGGQHHFEDRNEDRSEYWCRMCARLITGKVMVRLKSRQVGQFDDY